MLILKIEHYSKCWVFADPVTFIQFLPLADLTHSTTCNTQCSKTLFDHYLIDITCLIFLLKKILVMYVHEHEFTCNYIIHVHVCEHVLHSMACTCTCFILCWKYFQFDGLSVAEGSKAIAAHNQGFGSHMTQYRLRDWLIFQQCYWGAPIPIIILLWYMWRKLCTCAYVATYI